MASSSIGHTTNGLDSITGWWVNELGSEMRITVDADGRLSGEYRRASGALAGKAHPLLGHCQVSSRDEVPLAFVVDWPEAGSVTAWCGHYVAGPTEEIRTTWLMASEARPAEEWRATAIGHDVFTRHEAPPTYA